MKKTESRPKDLLGLEYLTKAQIEEILNQAKPMKQLYAEREKSAGAPGKNSGFGIF